VSRKPKDGDVGIAEIMGMFEVHELSRSEEIADFYCWDVDRVFKGVFLNGFCERPLEIGDVYLASVRIADGAARIVECSPRYEEEVFDIDWKDGEDLCPP
jgi:hypothetical protein